MKILQQVLNSKDPRDYTWEELEDIERRRRNILPRVEESFWGILSHWDGTVLRILISDSLFWTTVAIYAGLRVQARLDLPAYVANLGSGNVTVIGGFLSFFLVFWVNQNHKRFFSLYNKSMACKGRIFDVATIAVTTLPKTVATRLVRYMNAAHVSGYVGLSKTYPASSFFGVLNQKLGLLSEQELLRLNIIDLNKGGACNRELIAWCMREVQKVHQAGIIDNELANTLRTQVLELRANIGQLYNAADLPIPFFYVHFICLLTVLYLPLFAISTAYNSGTGHSTYWTADLVGALVVVLQAVFVIGLRVLGQKMSDPYGDDQIDLSVMHFCVFTWRQSLRVLKSQFPEETTQSMEDRLEEQCDYSVGDAWNENNKDDEEKAKGSNDHNQGMNGAV